MRFKTEEMKLGDTKTTSWFAILPVTIGNECRWLERVTVEWKVVVMFTKLARLPYPAWQMVQFM